MADIRRYDVVIEGMTALIMHWDNIEWSDEMAAWQANPANKSMSKAGDDRTPPWRWIGSVYHDGDVVCLPSDNLMTVLREGGAMVPVGKGAKTFKAQSQSGMAVTSPYPPLLINGQAVSWKAIDRIKQEREFSANVAAVRALGFNLFVKRAKVQTSKHVRVRPRFDTWSCAFGLNVWDDQLTETVISNIVEYAGQFRGLCDWRPGSPKSPGSYGIFKLVSLTRT